VGLRVRRRVTLRLGLRLGVGQEREQGEEVAVGAKAEAVGWLATLLRTLTLMIFWYVYVYEV
jgi:hypothetical protein